MMCDRTWIVASFAYSKKDVADAHCAKLPVGYNFLKHEVREELPGPEVLVLDTIT
jgi:hypothetical protein